MLKALQRWHTFLAARPDSEHETASLRLIVGTIAVAVLWVHWGEIDSRGHTGPLIAGIAIFYALACGIFVHICLRPNVCVPRRYLGIVVDIGCVTATLSIGESASTQGLMLLYLWITLANGLRFGQHYLWFALTLSVTSFMVVVASNPFWQQNQWLAIELVTSLVAVALYVRKLVSSLHKAMAREAAANAAKSTFVSRMSHEIRTPLMAVLALSDIVLGTKLRAEQRQLLTSMRDSSLHLRELVNDILDFSKIEAGKLTLEHREVNVRGLVWSVAGIRHSQARAKGIDLNVHVDPATPAKVYADDLRLRQVLLNLAGNAVKFTERGHVRITVTQAQDSGSNVRLAFAVEDTGVGIPQDKLGRIFESFSQADETITRKYGGTGLGTTISQQLVKLMGGEITVQSVVGQGSSFSFEIAVAPVRADLASLELGTQHWATLGFRDDECRELQAIVSGWGIRLSHYATTEDLGRSAADENWDLAPVGIFMLTHGSAVAKMLTQLRTFRSLEAQPVVLCSSDPSLLAHPPNGVSTVLQWPCERFDVFRAIHFGGDHTTDTTRPTTPPTRPLRVLVVDDVASNRVIVRAALAQYGHHCEESASPNLALDRCAAEHFDVVICDLNMPEMDGITLAKHLRTLDAYGDGRSAIIMLTGDATEPSRAAALRAGIDAFLTKPIRPNELAAAVARAASGKGNGVQAARLCGTADGTAAANRPQQTRARVVDDERAQELASLRPDDPTFLPRLQAKFIEEAETWLRRSRDALKAGNVDTIREAVHALEGSAGSLGLCGIEGVCRAHRGLQPSELHTRGATFVEAYGDAFNAAQAYLRAQTPTDGPV